MIRFLCLLAASGVMLASTPANASDWWFINVGGSNPRIVEFADRESLIRLPNGRVRAWTMSIRERATTSGQIRSLTMSEYDCERRESALVEIARYRENGEPMPVLRYPAREREFQAELPDSIGEGILNFACGRPGRVPFSLNDFEPVNGVAITPEMFARDLFRPNPR